MRFVVHLKLALLALTSASLIHAAEPEFTHVHPAAVQSGARTEVVFNGKFDPWPCQVFAATPGLTFEPQKEAGTFAVTVDAKVPDGVCLLRAYNNEGASAPVALVISSKVQISEKENNDEPGKEQVIDALPASINGRLDKANDVDGFQVKLDKDQTVVCWAQANVLGSGFDAMLRLSDSRHLPVAFNHDGPLNMDPLLVFQAPAAGNYHVQIMGHNYPASSDIRFAGGKDCVYRLHLSTGPVVRHNWPLADPVDGLLSPAGWNLPTGRMRAEPGIPVLFPMPSASALEVTEEKIAAERHVPFTLPCAVSGRIAEPGQEDRYTFETAKDAKFEFKVSSRLMGSEMDPWIRILDSQGKELAVNDDMKGGINEAHLDWSAPETGKYTAVVGELTQRGGPEFYYRLSVSPPVPGSGTMGVVETHAFKIQAGATAPIKVKVTSKNESPIPLTLEARNLPLGITADSIAVPARGGELVLTLTAAPDASPFQGAMQLVLKGAGHPLELPVVHKMVSAAENNGVPQGFQHLLIPETPDLWLTVTLPPAAKTEAAAALPAKP